MAKPDGVDMISDGRIKLVIDGEIITLRRPKIKQLRRLYDLLTEIDEAQKGVTGVGAQLKAAEQAAMYWRTCVEMLGDKPLPEEDDDLPVWLLSVELIVKAENHWRAVPYLSGG